MKEILLVTICEGEIHSCSILERTGMEDPRILSNLIMLSRSGVILSLCFSVKL